MQTTDNADATSGVKWSSKTAFILAAIGSAVGLGNLWRFPYVAGDNGGGAFVLFYLICVILIGLPVLAAELFIGRRGGKSAVGSVVTIAKAEGRSSIWAAQSWIGMFGSFIILTFYSVIAGWVLSYALTMTGSLINSIGENGIGALTAGAFAGETTEEVNAHFTDLLANPTRMIIFHAIFMIVTVGIVARGLKGGIEKAVTILMPAFFVMLIVLLGFALAQGDRAQGFDFLLGVRTDELINGLKNGSVINAALGQAFFSIGLGSALMSTYGAYMSKSTDIPGSTRLIGLADTAVGIIAGLALFPIVFAAGLAPGQGAGLMFLTLPLAFQTMPFGAIFGIIFFVLAFFAAITSSIALLESSTKWVDEQSKGNNRFIAALIIGVVIFVIGIANALSQVPETLADGTSRDLFWNTFHPGGNFPLFLDDGKPMKLLDFLSKSTDLILPIAGFITAIFAGWIVSTATSREELGFKTEAWYQRWRFLIRWVCPIGIGAVIIYSTIIAPFILNG